MVEKMLVSVVIPTKNRARLLKEAITSVMRQTKPVSEILVMDMKSRDDSMRVARSFGKKVRFISKSFKNQSESRNYGIKLAKGKLVAFLDSDDLWLEKKIENQLNFMKLRKQCAFSYTDAVIMDISGKEIPHSYIYYHLKKNPYFGKKLASKLLHEWNIIPTSSVVVPKKLLQRVGGFDERLFYHEDRDLWIRLAMKGEVCFLDETLAVYRVHPQQFTHFFLSPQQRKIREEQWKVVRDKYPAL
jgi:glycosyltransferase involved in cell wall biosynthesis